MSTDIRINDELAPTYEKTEQPTDRCSMNVYEMEGFLRGKCLPGDLLVGESNAAYLVRKLSEVSALKAERDAALKAIAAMYEFVTGERPEWSNWHAYLDDIVEEVGAAVASIEARGVEKFADRMLTLANDPTFGTGSYRNDLRTAGARARAYLSVLREAK